MNRSKSTLGLKEKILIGILIFLVCVLLFGSIFLIRGTRPYNRSQKEAEELALQYGKITEPEEFYYFNRKSQYFAVKGKTAAGKTTYALIPEDGKEITILKDSEGISENEALKIATSDNGKASFLKVGLGKEQDEIVWEISGKDEQGKWLYYLISFKEGKIVSKIQDI